MGWAAGSSGAPGNAPAESQECERENEHGDQQHSEYFEALPRKQALLDLEFAIFSLN
jgi:hypothetical protein